MFNPIKIISCIVLCFLFLSCSKINKQNRNKDLGENWTLSFSQGNTRMGLDEIYIEYSGKVIYRKAIIVNFKHTEYEKLSFTISQKELELLVGLLNSSRFLKEEYHSFRKIQDGRQWTLFIYENGVLTRSHKFDNRFPLKIKQIYTFLNNLLTKYEKESKS